MVSKLTENEKKKIYDIEPEIKLGKDFTVNSKKKLGYGAFGVIYSGFNNKTKEEVAIKLESQKTPTPQLLYESKILKLLQGGTGIPTVHYTSTIGDYAVMIIDYLDKNLEEILNTMKERKFSLKTVLMIADQISIIHRDIKPENFLLGLKKKSFLIYMIDYGLAKRYKNPKTGEHIPFLEGKQLTGTARYASIYTQLGIEQSRRDDLESLGYVLIYFLQGALPWQGIKSKTKAEKYKKILESKIKTVPVEICRDLPEEFSLYFLHIRSLQFDETPKYDYLKSLFKQLMNKNNYKNDFVFDWCIPANIIDKDDASQNKIKKSLSNKSDKGDCEIKENNKIEDTQINEIIISENGKGEINLMDDPRRESIITNIDANEITIQNLNLEDKEEICSMEKEND